MEFGSASETKAVASDRNGDAQMKLNGVVELLRFHGFKGAGEFAVGNVGKDILTTVMSGKAHDKVEHYYIIMELYASYIMEHYYIIIGVLLNARSRECCESNWTMGHNHESVEHQASKEFIQCGSR